MMPPARAPGDAKEDDDRHRREWRWAAEGRVAGAEALGTALLVLLSCLAGGAAAAGAVVALLVQCLDHVSGAMFNPAVTLAAALWGRVSPPRAASMLAAQLAGAALGAAALHALQAPAPLGQPALAPGLTLPAPGYSPYKAVCVEAVCGACLALANCAAWDARNVGLRDSWPLRIGTAVAALSFVAGPLTGASMNPARSFGPALLAARWTHHWVYWAGPLAGSLAATELYLHTWRPPRVAAVPPRSSAVL